MYIYQLKYIDYDTRISYRYMAHELQHTVYNGYISNEPQPVEPLRNILFATFECVRNLLKSYFITHNSK